MVQPETAGVAAAQRQAPGLAWPTEAAGGIPIVSTKPKQNHQQDQTRQAVHTCSSSCDSREIAFLDYANRHSGLAYNKIVTGPDSGLATPIGCTGVYNRVCSLWRFCLAEVLYSSSPGKQTGAFFTPARSETLVKFHHVL